MTRGEFQALAEKRVLEAKVLLDAGHFDGAYYLAGYAVECALKACIAKRFRQEDIPDKRFVDKIYVHNLEELLKHSEIDARTTTEEIEVNWSIVKDWSERSRYELGGKEEQAKDLYLAITDPKDGVLTWTKNSW